MMETKGESLATPLLSGAANSTKSLDTNEPPPKPKPQNTTLVPEPAPFQPYPSHPGAASEPGSCYPSQPHPSKPGAMAGAPISGPAPEHMSQKPNMPVPGPAPEGYPQQTPAPRMYPAAQPAPQYPPPQPYPQYQPPPFQYQPHQPQSAVQYGVPGPTTPYAGYEHFSPKKPMRTSKTFDSKTLSQNQYYLSIILFFALIIFCNPVAIICCIPGFHFASEAISENMDNNSEKALSLEKKAKYFNTGGFVYLVATGVLAVIGSAVGAGVYYVMRAMEASSS